MRDRRTDPLPWYALLWLLLVAGALLGDLWSAFHW